MPTRQLDSYSGPATISLEGEKPFEVMCRYTVVQDMLPAGDELVPGIVSWRGTFTTDDPLAWTGEGILTLPDGRSGRVAVSGIQMPTGVGRFVGNGAAP